MTYRYKPKGVCSSEFIFEISEENKIVNTTIIGGCHGNLQGIAKLIQGMELNEVITRLEGIRCGYKNTSCPDQIAKALMQYNSTL